MKKKKISKWICVSIICISLFSVLGFFVFFYTKAANTNIDQGNNVEEIEKPTVPEKKDFAKSDLTINFSLEQKIYMINFSKQKYFKMNEFKYYFLLEFNKLGPKNNSINLSYSVNDLTHPTMINVDYKLTNRTYTWNFKLI
ncbi:hypothetical protein [Spiroplasma endosymbiont of Diplazon laetatorius]|uniref:hypothetical protein n=1 Tax=Spiroplasma endosymbiont of Diplazon laetatorius TaxID=3066322 RepID=UPI0030CC62FD